VFCPNCGTKNADSEAKCAQCGFDLGAKAPQARFKGTMVMNATAKPDAAPAPAAPAAAAPAPTGQAPSGQAPAAAPKGGSLKGTMIGVAPPEMQRALEEAKARTAAAAAPTPPAAAPSAAAPAPTPKPSLKGTMIGVAPPDMQAAIAAAKAKVADAGPPATQASPGGAPKAAAPAPAAKPNIKGTMIGVAPPDMQAAIAAAKGELEKRLTDPAPAASPQAASPPATSTQPVNSKLKGTMMGVAPPDMAQAIAQAKASAAATAATPAAIPRANLPAQPEARPPAQPDFASTMVGTAAPVAESLRPTTTSSRPPSADLKGTMVGATSPFVESRDPHGDGPDSRAAGNSDHPEAFASTSLSAAAEIAAARANLQRVIAEAENPPKVPTARDIPTGAQSPAALRSMAQQGKKNALPVLLLGAAFIVVAALITFALLSRAKSTEPAPSDPAQPPPAAPK